ncbi:MAG: hypothetical protein ACKVP7_15380 [Hyphomicrobiaceae bacterium]
MTVLPDFKELVANDLERRREILAQNVEVRDTIIEALLAARDDTSPWKAYTPDSEAVDNVTKRVNVSCEDAFRLHLIISDGGKVTFPKPEGGVAMSIDGSTNALIEIAHRYAMHKFPDEAVVIRRSISAR